MEKKTINKFGEHYLLGIGKDNQKYYLEKESWSCGWYWGCGYIHTFTNNTRPTCSRDIASHQHFSTLFLSGPKCAYDNFTEFFKETVFSKEEIWKLVDYFLTIYKLKDAAEVFRHGNSWQTEKATIDILKCPDLENKINKEFLPELFAKIKELCTKKEETK
ncbi:MAG: hypothetical protein J6T10_06840 [Methanobrevibacter sp.]|nr:hypothetical protein [Methanobrevibacter sp.]